MKGNNRTGETEDSNMNIKMILTDLDHTLLRSDKTVSGYTKRILKKCQESGILVVIATARYWIGRRVRKSNHPGSALGKSRGRDNRFVRTPGILEQPPHSGIRKIAQSGLS